MISLLLLAFVVQLLIHLVNTLGATTINELLWALYKKLPTPTAKDANEATKLRREVVRIKRELASVSAQDEFSKWAKIRRQHDKIVADHEKVSGRVKDTRATFDKAANGLRWVGTTGARFLLQFWYSKKPMFWIPQGWVPYYAEWALSFPRAPLGSVSMQVWWIACASVILLVSEGIGATVTLARGTGTQKQKQEPMKMKATSGTDKASEKKEL
ncbi:protein get1 [Elsinoe australis]|uniref:Protein get1 n=1 Tax=Elsinoe australis TaxID=40998 RepID=A0A4U7AQA5_9PEZI|nr:protein get1 [Elsinoe australis]